MATKKTADIKDLVSGVFEKVDPEIILAGIMGGIAARGGATPPLARLIGVMGGESGQPNDLQNLVNAAQAFTGGFFTWGVLLGRATSGSQTSKEEMSAEALFAVGFLDAMISMSLVKNPGLPDLIGKLVDKIPSVKI